LIVLAFVASKYDHNRRQNRLHLPPSVWSQHQ